MSAIGDYILAIKRMADEELIEYLIELTEDRAVLIYMNEQTEMIKTCIKHLDDSIETVKTELLRRM